MANAFKDQLNEHKSCVIIGTDCYELDTETINQAFTALEDHDAVIGPALDGGYYLFGMNKFRQGFFENKAWSTASVFRDTIRNNQSL
jgi:hypothetical protein